MEGFERYRGDNLSGTPQASLAVQLRWKRPWEVQPGTKIYRTPPSASGSALRLGRALRGLDRGLRDGLEVGFGDVGSLLGSLVHAFVRVVGGGDGRLHQRDGILGAGRGVLDGGGAHRPERLLRGGSVLFRD